MRDDRPWFLWLGFRWLAVVALAPTPCAGQARFVELPKLHVPRDYVFATALALGDLDSDGDPDLVASVEVPGGLAVHVCLQGSDNVFALASSRPGRLTSPPVLADLDGDFHSRPGSGTPGLALPFLAPAGARLPIPPPGVFRLDPASSIALPSVPIPQPAGVGSLQFPIPNLPILDGLPLYTQALIFTSASLLDARLTNVETDRIRRL